RNEEIKIQPRMVILESMKTRIRAPKIGRIQGRASMRGGKKPTVQKIIQLTAINKAQKTYTRNRSRSFLLPFVFELICYSSNSKIFDSVSDLYSSGDILFME